MPANIIFHGRRPGLAADSCLLNTLHRDPGDALYVGHGEGLQNIGRYRFLMFRLGLFEFLDLLG
jgi:hypothetical protein